MPNPSTLAMEEEDRRNQLKFEEAAQANMETILEAFGITPEMLAEAKEDLKDHGPCDLNEPVGSTIPVVKKTFPNPFRPGSYEAHVYQAKMEALPLETPKTGVEKTHHPVPVSDDAQYLELKARVDKQSDAIAKLCEQYNDQVAAYKDLAGAYTAVVATATEQKQVIGDLSGALKVIASDAKEMQESRDRLLKSLTDATEPTRVLKRIANAAHEYQTAASLFLNTVVEGRDPGDALTDRAATAEATLVDLLEKAGY